MPHIQIPAVRPRISHTAAGTGPYAFPFPIFVASDLIVTVAGVVQASGYTVTGAGQTDGGSVTFDTAPTAGATITLLRATPIARTSDFEEGGAFRAIVLNDDLDRIVAGVQQIDERLDRAVTVSPDSPTTLNLQLPIPVAGRALVWDAEADALINSAYNPDETVAQASAAAASAAAASTSAATAASAAAAAAESAASAGVTGRQTFAITLEVGVLDYALPRAVSGPAAVDAFYGESYRMLPGTDFTIADTHGPLQTLRLVGSVTATGAEDGAWKAGERVSGIAHGPVVDGGLGPASVRAVHLATDSVTAPAIAAGAVGASELAASIDMAGKIAVRSIDIAGLAASGTTGSPLVRSSDGGVAVGSFPALPTDTARWQTLGEQSSTLSTLQNSFVWTVPGDLQTFVAEFDLRFSNLGTTLDTILYVQLATGSGPTWTTAGYTGSIGYPGYLAQQISAAPFSGVGWPLLRSYGSSGTWVGGSSTTGGNRVDTIACVIERLSARQWRIRSHHVQSIGSPGGTQLYTTGLVTLPADAVSAVRIQAGQTISPGATMTALVRW